MSGWPEEMHLTTITSLGRSQWHSLTLDPTDHNPTNPSSMSYHLLSVQHDDRLDGFTNIMMQQASHVGPILSQHLSASHVPPQDFFSTWGPGNKQWCFCFSDCIAHHLSLRIEAASTCAHLPWILLQSPAKLGMFGAQGS